jgi:hypothetical protein
MTHALKACKRDIKSLITAGGPVSGWWGDGREETETGTDRSLYTVSSRDEQLFIWYFITLKPVSAMVFIRVFLSSTPTPPLQKKQRARERERGVYCETSRSSCSSPKM